MIDRKTIGVGDTVWTSIAGCDARGPWAFINGGLVLAVGDDGTFVYRRDDGRIESVASYSVHSFHQTAADAWAAAADRLMRLSQEVVEKSAECRKAASGEVSP